MAFFIIDGICLPEISQQYNKEDISGRVIQEEPHNKKRLTHDQMMDILINTDIMDL